MSGMECDIHSLPSICMASELFSLRFKYLVLGQLTKVTTRKAGELIYSLLRTHWLFKSPCRTLDTKELIVRTRCLTAFLCGIGGYDGRKV